MHTFILSLVFATVVASCSGNAVSTDEWNKYKLDFGKSYATTAQENTARYYYAVNKARVSAHNVRFNNNLESYKLDVNQYSDLRFLEFAALFPQTTDIPSNADDYISPAATPQASFTYSAQGYTSPIRDQGRTCNSGWAYAAATALDIHQANTGATSAPLSAQNFIDCAGAARSCVNQVAQIAYDYLTQFGQSAYPETDYPNTPDEGQGMCIQPANLTNAVNLTSYGSVMSGNETALMSVVNYLAPVVVQFNPGTFEFMHYNEGIFTQPTPTQTASHYMTVIGYGTDTTSSKDYWLLQNSFGTTWGEMGLIRIERNALKPITRSAIFPSA